jgi:hypothetical protein
MRAISNQIQAAQREAKRCSQPSVKKRALAAKITELKASYLRQKHHLLTRVVDPDRMRALSSVARQCVEAT